LKKINSPIFYVTNDVARGIGLENILPNYHIICLDDHPLVDILEKAGVSVFCLERQLGLQNALYRSSGTILSHPKVLSFIKEKAKGETPNILFFKPQRKIEIIAEKNKLNLIGNPVSLNRFFEDKISFFEICRKEGITIPSGEIINLPEIDYFELAKKYGDKLVIQFGRGWAGNSTIIVSDEKQIAGLKSKTGNIKVKVSKFISSKTILNNAVVYQKKVLVSEPAVQIKANALLTSTQAGTGGRQWPCPLDETQKKKIKEITIRVGRIMQDRNFKGFFGLDFLAQDGTGEIFLAENNSRLTYSAPFFTKLELSAGVFPLLGYHLLAFLPEIDLSSAGYNPAPVLGGEIVARNTESFSVKVGREVKTGLYNNNFKFDQETYFLDTQDKDKFFLQAAAKNRIINPEIEFARINTSGQVADENGELSGSYLKIIQKVKDDLTFSKCQV